MPIIAIGDGASDHSSNLYMFTYGNGTVSNVVHIGETGAVMLDVAINRAENPWGRVFAISEFGALYSIDLTTAASTYIGSTGLVLSALEFCNGTLYGWGDNLLVAIDPTNAQTTLLGRPTWNASGDLMCTPTGLWGIALSRTGGNDTLVQFTGTVDNTPVGIDLPGKEFYGGVVDGEGTMFVARKSGRSSATLYIVSGGTVTAVSTFVTGNGLYGLTTYPAAW